MGKKINKETLLFLTTDLSRLLRATIEQRIAESDLGLTPSEARTLAFAAHMDKPPQTKLAAEMGVDPMTVSGYLSRLEERGLIARISHPDDRRVKRIEITCAATPVLAFLKQQIDQIEERACRGMSEEKRKRVIELLSDTRANLIADLNESDTDNCPPCPKVT